MIQQEACISPIKYIQRFDSVPEFWQFIRGLKSDDLVAELIQNELDANSTHTVIVFNVDRMTCYGNGDQVDEDGWERLTYITGAGDLAPRKRGQIGVKNHGIKVCFTIGDDINIRSDGQMMHQTLYINGADKPPSPATYARPDEDATAPATGCLIEARYRVKHLTIDSGEPFSFAPITATKIEGIFLRACQEAPRRFIGALRPDIRKKYVLELKHHQLGTAHFEFSCGRIRTVRGLNFYNRMCCTSGAIPELPEKIVESCCLFKVPLPKDSNKEIPEFYASKGKFFLSEISWRVERKNRPVSIRGHRRYPIEYGGTDQSAYTGLGVNFSAPYVSDLERHRAVEGDTFNECMENASKSILVKILRLYLIPKYGARALDLLIDPEKANEATLRNMVKLTLDAGAFPILRHKPMTQHDKKRPRNKKLRTTVRFGPSKTTDGDIRRIVLPMFTWDESKISPLLSQLCPSKEDQVDPSVPSPILSLLADTDIEGFFDNRITFDETDVIDRLQPMCATDYFPWNNEGEWKRELGGPNVMHLCLDVLMAIYEHDHDNEKMGGLLENAYLPDTTSTPVAIKKLYAGINLPSNLPIEDIPPILHPSISNHRIFKKIAWKRPPFTFSEFLERAALDKADEQKRALFWCWLKSNWQRIKIKPQNPWPTLVGLQIWPDTSGKLQILSALCRPQRKSIASILKGSIKSPHRDVLKVSSAKKGAKRGALPIRSVPTESEFTGFLQSRLSVFPEDRALSAAEKGRFHSLESDLAELASHKAIRSYLKDNSGNAFAVSRSSYVRSVKDLVQINSETEELYLIDDDIVERGPSVLDRIDSWKPKAFPSSEQVLRVLQEDPHGYLALYRRLRAYLQAAKREGKVNVKEDIGGIECIPDGGKLYSPDKLAFGGNRIDYWGSWKHRISGQGMGADIQQLYRDIGVLGTEPTPEMSREFFQWLSAQGHTVLASNLHCIIRHINHDRGPKTWSPADPDIPFIPVVKDEMHVSLVSRASALSPRGMIFIPDHDALVEAIKNGPANRVIQLVITRHRSVTAPITPYMQQLGVKSLRDYAGNPTAVQTTGPRDAPASLLEELKVLYGRKMSRELRKRLDSMGLPSGTYSMKSNWHERLMQIQNMNIVDSLTATFKVGRYRYDVQTEAAFDQSSSTIFLVDSSDNLDALFYRTIAERVFESPSEWVSVVLREAVRREYRETVLHSEPLGQSGDRTEEDAEVEDGEQEREGIGPELGEAKRTHRRRDPDPTRNIPDPGEIPTSITSTSKHHRNRNGEDGGRRESPKIEEKQIEDLKQRQYAWHCQICLTERTVEQLAPAKSYVEIHENRRGLIKAHHVDQVHAGGARHAGNILILCNYHHRQLGDRISGQDVIKALKETASDHTVVFKTFMPAATVQKGVSGKIATITIPLEGNKIKCFFTESHADHWLPKATRGK